MRSGNGSECIAVPEGTTVTNLLLTIPSLHHPSLSLSISVIHPHSPP